MTPDQERADRLLQQALESSGARDPREFYRERLRVLKQADPGVYDQAVAYYRDVLVPGVAEERTEPLAAWTEYGKRLAELEAPGTTLAVDPTGRARPYEPPVDPAAMILHIPTEQRRMALVVGLPPELSSAQRATYDWLVAGRQTLRD